MAVVDPGAFFTETCTLRDVEADVGRVTIVSGPDAGTEHPFAEPTLTLGTAETASLRLSDRGVSRLHCQLVREGAVLRLRDLGSKNGTWLGGHRVIEALIGPGAQVRVGATLFETGIDRRRLRQAVWHGGDRFGPVTGASSRMQELFGLLARVVDRDARVLVTGESGSGKELVARALHDLGPRRDGPFVVLDGGALSRTLADVELFGHARGAFTDAHVDRPGAFERAHGGTLFLDEIGELPLDIQPKLLRAVESGTVHRIGEAAPRPVDVRIIAATHRSLPRMINEGTFREDLYYRLAVVAIDVPPLRERGQDVKLLGRGFLSEVAPGRDDLAAELDAVLDGQAGYRWPGNVRELRHFVRRFALLGQATIGDGALRPVSEPTSIRVDMPFGDAKQQWIESFERQYLATLLDETGGNLTEASRRSGLARSRMYELVVQYGLRRPR